MSNKKKYIIVGITGTLILLSVLALYNRYLIMAYYYSFKKNHFSKGEQVYAADRFVSNTSTLNIPLYRLIKSTTSSDFQVVSTQRAIVNDSLRKYKTACIATYINHVFVPISYKDQNRILDMCAVLPNWKLTEGTNKLMFDMPKNYVFADNNFYIMRYYTADKETSSSFK